MKMALGLIPLALLLTLIQPALAVTRHLSPSPFRDRTSISGYIGPAIPVGNFSDGKYGNHEAGGLDWSLELEHYFGPNFSAGFCFAASSYDDKDLGDNLTTNLNTLGGFFRYLYITPGQLHPFFKFAVGWMEVEFDSPEETVDAPRSETVGLSAGLLYMLSNNVSLNGQTIYTHAWTEDAYISEADAVVGFDVSSWAFNIGLSVYFP